MFPALCGDPVLGFLMTNWVKNKVQLNNWSMPFRKPSFSKKLKTWKYFKIKWNLTILQLRFCILMAKFGISIKFWSRNMYDDVCMMTFQKCHFLSRIVTKISNCVFQHNKSKINPKAISEAQTEGSRTIIPKVIIINPLKEFLQMQREN